MAQKDAEHTELWAALNEGRVPGGDVSNENPDNLPSSIQLDQNYPNPFNPTTNIKFELANAGEVQLEVYDALGRKVMTLINNEYRQAGAHEIQFNAENLSSGVYMYMLKADNVVQSKTMTLIK